MFVSAFLNEYENSKLIKEDVDCTSFKLGDNEFFRIVCTNLYELIYECRKGGIYYQAIYLLPLGNISFSDITFFLSRVMR